MDSHMKINVSGILNKPFSVYFAVSVLFICSILYSYSHNFIWKNDLIIFFSSLPLILLIIYLAVFRYDWLWYLIIFLVPLSIEFENISGINVGVYFPTEPLIFLLMLIVPAREFLNPSVSAKHLRHPLSLIVIIQLLWIIFTAITSELPLISLKFTLVHLWYVICFFYFSLIILNDLKKARRFFIAFGISLVCVIIYTSLIHIRKGLNLGNAYTAPVPFFRDHAIYGACIGFMLPAFLFLAIDKNVFRSIWLRFMLFIFFLVVVFGAYASFSRALWGSVIIAAGISLLYFFRVNPKHLGILLLILLMGGILFLPGYLEKKGYYLLTKNTFVLEREQANIETHLISAVNISSDVSNLERINRWAAALRIIQEHPVLGTGGGTFQHVYGAYQISSLKTPITTYHGTGGDCHNEYLTAFSETGIIGGILFLLLVIFIYKTSLASYRATNNKSYRTLLLCASLGLTTYFVHGMFNNYLNSDKCSVPFWFFIALILAIDVKVKSEKTTS